MLFCTLINRNTTVMRTSTLSLINGMRATNFWAVSCRLRLHRQHHEQILLLTAFFPPAGRPPVRNKEWNYHRECLCHVNPVQSWLTTVTIVSSVFALQSTVAGYMPPLDQLYMVYWGPEGPSYLQRSIVQQLYTVQCAVFFAAYVVWKPC